MESIDEVIVRLQVEIDDAHVRESRLGFFAALYRRMTVRIKEAIEAGVFEDGPRLERLDVAFAERYFEAVDALRDGRPVTDSWDVAFRTAKRPGPLIFQHLLLGINAHINLDLGIVTATLVPPEELPLLERDFMSVNGVLEQLLDEVQSDINALSPWFGVVDFVGGRVDEHLFGFSLARARDGAWAFANTLAKLAPEARPAAIRVVDGKVAKLGTAIARPSGLLRIAQWIARRVETKDVREVIAGLR